MANPTTVGEAGDCTVRVIGNRSRIAADLARFAQRIRVVEDLLTCRLSPDESVSITFARPRAVFDLNEVQGALDRSRGRSPELDALYERMLETGAERFVTAPSTVPHIQEVWKLAKSHFYAL
jgi:hypothetical protein